MKLVQTWRAFNQLTRVSVAEKNTTKATTRRLALAVSGSGSAFDESNSDHTEGGLQIVEDTVVADSAAPTKTFTFEAGDIAYERIIRHLVQDGPQTLTVRRGRASETFFGFF